MARGRTKENGGPGQDTTVRLGFEATLWQAADALRNNMDAAEYKHVVARPDFSQIHLRRVRGKARRTRRAAVRKAPTRKIRTSTEPKTSSGCRRRRAGRTSRPARQQPTIGTIVDDAMGAIERDNPSLKGVLPKDYARPGLDKQRLGQLINLVSDIGLGSPADRARDILGRVYEYFLAQFASAEGKEGRPVLYAIARRAGAGRDAGAL